jgi:hypothetical protein
MDTSELDFQLDSHFEIPTSILHDALDCYDLDEMYARTHTSYETLAYKHYASRVVSVRTHKGLLISAKTGF